MGALRAVLCLAAIGSAAREGAAGLAGDGRTVAVDEEAAAAALVDEPRPARRCAKPRAMPSRRRLGPKQRARDPIAVERTLLRAEDLFEGEKCARGRCFRRRIYLRNPAPRECHRPFHQRHHGDGVREERKMWIETTHEVRDGEKPYLEYFFAVAGFGQGWLKEVSGPGNCLTITWTHTTSTRTTSRDSRRYFGRADGLSSRRSRSWRCCEALW